MRYLITFNCYGHRLHGNSDGSVDKRHRLFGTPHAPASPGRLAFVRRIMREPVNKLGPEQRRAVLQSLLEAARRRGWRIWAAHVRPTHTHVVAEAEAPPEEILRGLESSCVPISLQIGQWAMMLRG
jgi:hypothetical protein